jgi:methanethiol S-methyltransferase
MKYGAYGSMERRASSQPGPAGESAAPASLVKRTVVFAYGTITYAITLGIFAYAAGFIGNFGVPKAMDSGREVPLIRAIALDALLLGVFAIQHSVMARGWFKRWLTRFIPQAAERSTYVLASCVLMILLFWEWQPIGGTVWNVENSALRAALYGLYTAGWILLLLVTFLINHFDLFGMRQVWYFLRGREMPPLRFVTPGPYKLVRHPLYVGWFTIFWATPTMTVAHLLFAVLTSAYILVAIQFEERDLVANHGRPYAEYRKQVPMLIPRLSGKEPLGPRAAPESAEA